MHALTTLRGLSRIAGRGLAAASILALALVAGPLRPHDTFASIGFCREDPVIVLTNGHVMQLGAVIGDDAADVQQIAYHVVGPQGARVVKVINISGALASKVTVDYTDSNAPNTYDSDVMVTTGTPGVAVTAEGRVNNVGYATISGQSGQDLTIHLAT